MSGGGGVRILLVEDEASVRDAVARILANYGHEVVAAADGPEGLLYFKRGGFDIVMTDLGLPGPSGWEVAKAVREISPDTPVVLLSGWDVSPGDKDLKESGVARVLAKPVSVKDMLMVITELVSGGSEG